MKKRQILVRGIYHYHINVNHINVLVRNCFSLRAHRSIYNCGELYSCVFKSKSFDIGKLMPIYYSFIHLPAGQK